MSTAPPAVPPLDLLVLGSGVAGLSAAVRAATTPGMRVGVLTKGELHQSATRWAQGGVAAVLSTDEDSTDLHLADTLAAGAGLCDTDAVRVLVDEGPARVHELIALGAVFDTDHDGSLALAREGGHSMPRVVHAGGAATGAEIERALVQAVRATAAAVLDGWFALDLLVEGGRCVGVVALDPGGVAHEVRATHTLLATGGAGQLFAVTTNPTEATGDGVAMALRAGVAVADVEFMQFHPTALHHPAMPRPLLSEALRGHGALLRDAEGNRFVDELLPRDQVSVAMTTRMLDQGVDHLWLDATGLEGFDERFPTIAASVRGIGLDPAVEWLPIAPAAHYLSGGLVTDLDGATSVAGLWACGEVACTGVHGANRLASNSLLEGMVFAPRIIEAIERGVDGPAATGAMRTVFEAVEAGDGSAGEGGVGHRSASSESHGGLGEIGGRSLGAGRTGPPAPAAGDGRSSAAVGGADGRADVRPAAQLRDELQRSLTRSAGVVRSEGSLHEAAAAVRRVLAAEDRPADAAHQEVRNLAVVGAALVDAALARTESRGNHRRSDHPATDAALRLRLVHR